MNNEEKILHILTQMQTDISGLKQGQDKLEQGQSELNQKVLRLELILENEVKRDIKIIAENHSTLNDKLDELKGLNQKIIDLQDDNVIIKQALKAVK